MEVVADKRLVHPKIRVDNFRDTNAVAARIGKALQNDAYVLTFAGEAFSQERLDEWEQVLQVLGKVRADGENGATGELDGSVWIDVRYDSERAHTFRHSATAQPLHTDSAYNPAPVDMVFFYCQHQAKSGGATLFISAEALEEAVRDHSANLHARLWEMPLPYGKGQQAGRSVPVFERDERGILLNWNYYRVLEANAEIAKLRQEFHDFLQQQIVVGGKAEAVYLSPGESLIFEDRRVLHGRNAFEPSPRCLWKCGLDWRI